MDSTIFFGTISSAAILVILLVLYATIKPSSVRASMMSAAQYSAPQIGTHEVENVPTVMNVESSNTPEVAVIQNHAVEDIPATSVLVASESSRTESQTAEQTETKADDAVTVPEIVTAPSTEPSQIESSPPVEIATPPTSFALPTDVSALSNATSSTNAVSDATSIKKWNYGYCVKCKSKKQIRDPFPVVMKNGRNAVRGLCPDCNTKIFKIGAMV